MNFKNLILWLPKQLQNFVLALGELGRVHIQRTTRALRHALFVNVVMMLLGLVLEVIGFRADWMWLLSFGHFLVTFSGTLAAGLWLYTWTRIWVLVNAGVRTNEVASAVVREVSRPLPSNPVAIPQLLTQELADRTLQGIMAGLAGVAFGSMYAGFFPVYTNLGGLFVTVTAGFVIGFVTYNPTAKASTTIRKYFVPIAISVIAINTALCLFSYDAERFTRLSNAEGKSSVQVTEAEVVLIEALQQERAQIITSAATRPNHKFTADEEKRMEEIGNQIYNIRYPIVKQVKNQTPSFSTNWITNQDPTIWLFIAAGALGIWFVIRPRTHKAH